MKPNAFHLSICIEIIENVLIYGAMAKRTQKSELLDVKALFVS